MRILYGLGWFLFLAGIGSTVGEVAARYRLSSAGILMSSHDLLFALWPRTLVMLQTAIETLLPDAVWDPLMLAVLQLPAWFLLGAPGLALLWRYSPRRGEHELDEESMTLYDRLADRAREEGDLEDDAPAPRGLPPPPIGEDNGGDEADGGNGQAEAPDGPPPTPRS